MLKQLTLFKPLSEGEMRVIVSSLGRVQFELILKKFKEGWTLSIYLCYCKINLQMPIQSLTKNWLKRQSFRIKFKPQLIRVNLIFELLKYFPPVNNLASKIIFQFCWIDNRERKEERTQKIKDNRMKAKKNTENK